MLFRKRLFTILAILAMLWIITGFWSISTANNKKSQIESSQTSSAAKLGDAAVTGIASSVVLCTGVPLFFLFALLAWRNGVGLTNRKRHEEMLAALQQNQNQQT